MKIVTVNIPESYIGAINKLIRENGLYPSRSELIRVAVRDFLLKEIKMANNIAKYNQPDEEVEKDFDEENFVRVPIEKINEKSEPIREFKTYKILKRLEYNTSEKINKPDIQQLRENYPNLPDFKYINEGLIFGNS